MENFLVCLNAVLPIFVIMALGYAARCSKVISRDDVPKLNKLAFRFFMANPRSWVSAGISRAKALSLSTAFWYKLPASLQVIDRW